MKLLQKSDIARAKSIERTKEIEEGLKLSRRVDGLRELSAKEEAALEKFRIESLSALMQEIKETTEKKDFLFSEIQSLREEKMRGLSEVEQKKSELAVTEVGFILREKSLEEKSNSVSVRESEIAKKLSYALDEVARARSQSEEADRMHQDAFQAREDALKTVRSARELEDKALESRLSSENSIKAKWVDVNKHEELVMSRESALKNELFSLRAKEAELSLVEQSLTGRDALIASKIEEIGLENEKLERNLSDARDELQRAKTHKEEALRIRREAQKDREDAVKTLENVESEQKRVYDVERETVERLLKREKSLEMREKELEVREVENDKISKELENRAIKLADRSKVREKILENLEIK